MPKSRRQFLALALLAHSWAAAPSTARRRIPLIFLPERRQLFGTAPPVGPEVSPTTLAEAEKTPTVELTTGERAMAANSWRKTMAPLYERRHRPAPDRARTVTCPRLALESHAAGLKIGPDRDRFIRSKTDPVSLPDKRPDIAFASVLSSPDGSSSISSPLSG